MKTREEEARQLMAEVLRAAAQLVEEGVITDWSIDREFGHDTGPDPSTGGATLRMTPNGNQTVKITLQTGHLSRDRVQAWLTKGSAAEATIGGPQT